MRHAIEYQGSYEKNIERIRNGARTYLRRDGSEGEFGGPSGVDGVRFGLLQKAAGAGFLIARVQFGTLDIPLKRPIKSAGIGPRGKRLTKPGALALLKQAKRANPDRRSDLDRVMASVESARGDDKLR